MFETTTCGSRSASNLAGRAPLGSVSTTRLCSRGWLRHNTIHRKRPEARGAAPDAAQVLVRGLGQPGREVGRGVVHGQLAADAELAEVGVLLKVLPLPVVLLLLLLFLPILQLLARLGGALLRAALRRLRPGPGQAAGLHAALTVFGAQTRNCDGGGVKKRHKRKPVSHWRPGAPL